jgi:hypothetical protein
MTTLDIALLHDHLRCCMQLRGPLHRLRAAAEAVDEFLAPRFVTTLVLTLLVLASASLAA